LKVNIDLRLYYDPKRPGRSAKYIGFYSEKAVRGIGILSKVARVERIKGELRVVEGPALSSRELARVAEAMDSAVVYGWNIDQGGYFFLTDEIQSTMFVKETKYPLWSRRYLNLRAVLGIEKPSPLPRLDVLANGLRGESWH
jgi:hypothetical protein